VELFCDHGKMKIEVENGLVQIDQLKFGDKIKTIKHGKMALTKFIGYGHSDKSFKTDFIIVKSASTELEITNDHLIPINKTNKLEFVPARQLEIGNEIFVKSLDQEYKFEKIISLETIKGEGIYAPMTESGTLLVNNVFASCFANVYSQNKAQMVLAPIRALFKLQDSEFDHADKFLELYRDSILSLCKHKPFSNLINATNDPDSYLTYF